MMTKEEYKKNIVRMFDSIRSNHKGEEGCMGIRCIDCPFDGKTCNLGAPNFRAFEGIEIVEQWAKEHPVVTNADKFKEVFGTEPSKSSCVNVNIQCGDCKYLEGSECAASTRFWDAEYKKEEALKQVTVGKYHIEVTDIEWDADGVEVELLPSTVNVPVDIEEEDVADWLSDTYGWCVCGFTLVKKMENTCYKERR